MRFLCSLAISGLLLVLAGRAAAAPRTTYFEVVREFRSVTCQGETLEQCTSPASEALKAFIREKVEQGWTKEEIVRAVVAEYGEGILAAPPRRGMAWWLWVTPFALLPLGVFLIGTLFARPRPKLEPAPPSASLSSYLAEVEREVREE